MREAGFPVQIATQDMPEHGLTEMLLAETDVLVFWSHGGRAEFEDAIVERIYERTLDGMG